MAAVLLLLLLIWPVTQYLGLVLRNPQRTGMLVIGATYSAPWDVNPWCAENIAALERLDKHNLSIRRVTDPSALIFGQWAELLDDVEHLTAGTEPHQPLLVYINLHGVVSDDGQPCLLVHESQPLESSTWLPLDQLVRRLRQALPGQRPVIIAIEGGRAPAIFPQAENHIFADAVRDWFAILQAAGHAQGLAVILSSSSEFGSVKHAGMSSDLFTGVLAEALSGACDDSIHGGNANQQIQWNELVTYVHDQVEDRSRRLRAVPQLTEQFVASDDAPEFLAWGTALRPASPVTTEPIEVNADQVERLTQVWQRLYALRSATPWHEEPHVWGSLKRMMVAWEQSLFGGVDAQSQVEPCQRSAEQLVVRLESLVSSRPKSSGLESQLAQRAAQLWHRLETAPSLETARVIVESELTAVEGLPVSAVPMLSQAVELKELKLWRDGVRLQALASTESRIEQVRADQYSIPRLPELVELESVVDRQRRQLEDLSCVDSLDEHWDAKQVELAASLKLWQVKSDALRAALAFNEQMSARLPAMIRVIDLMESAWATEPDNRQDDSLVKLVESIVATAEHNRDAIAAAWQGRTPVDDLLSASDKSNELFTKLAQAWQRMVFDTSIDTCDKVLALEALLDSSLLPVEVGSIDKAVRLRLTTHQRLMQAPVHSEDVAVGQHELNIGSLGRRAIARWISWSKSNGLTKSSDHDRLDHQWIDQHTARGWAGFGLGDRLSQPVANWQSIQYKLRLAEAGRRVLDDFWKLPQVNGEDYFAASTRALLESADLRDRDQLDGWLRERVQAAEHGLKLECQCRPVWDEQTNSITACRIVQGQQAVPVGLASLRIVESGRAGRSLSQSAILEVGQLQPGVPRSLNLPTELPKLPTDQSPVIARLVFRGHQFDTNFDLHPRVGHTAGGVTTGPGPTSITVQSTARKQRARMIVLDCSASMYQPQPAEGILASGTTAQQSPVQPSPIQPSPIQPSSVPTRLDAARLALKEILNHWRGGADHVGVVFYGHRVALGTKEQGKLIQTRYHSRYPFSQEMEAYEDVETVLTPGRFGDQEFSEVMARMDSVVPWGQTPLYLSVSQATQELKRYVDSDRTPTQPKVDLDVIVISDGRNYQFNPSSAKNISLEQTIEQARQLGVRVHVIGFGVATSELEQATHEFTQLAQQTGGSVSMEVQTAMQLVGRVDALTEPESFRVRLPDGSWQSSPCGVPVDVPNLLASNTPIVVDYQRSSTLVPLNPSSAVRLAPGSANRLVRAQAVFHPSARTSISTHEGQASPFDIVIKTPERNATGLQWQLALERRDELVAQRPRYCWIELTANKDSSEAPSTTYVVCDSLWANSTSEPILSFETQDWPGQIDTSRIKLWCSDKLPEPITKFQSSSQELIDNWLSLNSRWPGAGQVEYQLRAEPDGVTLVLLHGQPSEVLELMPLLDDLPSQTRVERRYCPEQRISIHRFTHPSLRSGANLDIAVYSVSAFKQQALRSTTQLEVKLPTPSLWR